MRLAIIILFIFMPYSMCSQQLSCEDFKQGKFFIPAKDSQGKEIKVYVSRNLQNQKEYTKATDTIYSNIEWISSCSYRITFNTTKMNLSSFQQWTQTNNGLVVTMKEIVGKCISYHAIMNTKEGGEIGQHGKICIE